MKKILVANRGEIALRIMRSAKEAGYKTVGVFSEADRNALHVRYADEAVCIGPPASSQSYLNIDKIIEVCKLLKVDAVHPGYGFLSENAAFSKRVTDEGFVFIGPSAHSMDMMGNKLSAKEAVKKFKIPTVPGTEGAVADIEEAKKVSVQIGFPVLIKAAAGGGGKGMRVVNDDADFEEQVKMAMSEAKSAFGDGSVFIERYVGSPRHIEIQVLADNHGNVVHLFERECSVQRRHQKVIEEAPSSILTPEIREMMGKSAVDVAKACNYSGAGTVEFLMDENRNYYFLEMNTRLQVEHPVTEFITGLDLVKEQIRIAFGEPLGYNQNDLTIKGHSIEIRVYAEDAINGFLPSIGKLSTYKTPKGKDVRVDDAFEQGMNIPIYYDPMIAKLIVYGKNREEAMDRMIRAIDEYEITGVETTLAFCRFVMKHEAFRSGMFDTNFVKNHFKPEYLASENLPEKEIIAGILAANLVDSHQQTKKNELKPIASSSSEGWIRRRKFR